VYLVPGHSTIAGLLLRSIVATAAACAGGLGGRAIVWPVGHELPLSTRLVVRDRGGADSETVLLAAIEDMVADGAWRHDRVRRKLISRVDVILAVRPPTSGCEPLGEHSIKELRPTESGQYQLRDLPRCAQRERDGVLDVESPRTRAVA
jgi:hypothetical protein